MRLPGTAHGRITTSSTSRGTEGGPSTAKATTLATSAAIDDGICGGAIRHVRTAGATLDS